MRTLCTAGLVLWMILTLGCAGCNPVMKELGEKPDTGPLLESAGETQDLAGKASESAETTAEKTELSAGQAKDLAAKVPAALKPEAQAHARTAQEAAESARKTGEAVGKVEQAANAALTIAIRVDRDVSVREEKVENLAKETRTLRKSAQTGLLATLLAHVALLAGLGCFGGGAYALYVTKSKLLATMASVAGVVFIGGYFVTMHQDVVQTGFMALMVLLIIALVVKLVFFRQSVIGIATAVKADANAEQIAAAADSQTRDGLGSGRGKLKLLVGG